MTSVALVQDGTEVGRQAYADVASCFADARDLIDPTIDLETYTDEAVGYFLHGITPQMCSCIVLASNALLSEAVSGAFRGAIEQLHDYLDGGGGLLILHQLVDDIGWLLPGAIPLPLLERRLPPTDGADAHDADDVLLW